MEQQAIHAFIVECLKRAQTSQPYVQHHVPRPREPVVRIGADTAAGWATSPYVQTISILGCPSDQNFPNPDRRFPAKSNYCANSRGDVWGGWEDAGGRGVFQTGHFQNGRLIDFGAIEDGTSNTVMFSEQGVGIIDQEQNIRLLSSNVNNAVWNGTSINPAECAAVRGSRGTLDIARGPAGTNIGQGWNNLPDYTNHFGKFGWTGGKGMYWASGNQQHTQFYTILPPNSPSCRSGSTESRVLISASSYHSGGVNAGLVDGSVRFISETIDVGNINARLGASGTDLGPEDARTYTGPSTFGVWGALGTINGGESVSL